MKKLITSLLCLFLVIPCYASYSSDLLTMDYSKIGKEAAERTNNELEEEIKDVINMDEIRWLLQSQRDLNSLKHMRYLREEVRRKALIQYRLNTTGHLFGGLLKLGIGYWGFTQKTTYGNVTGALFTISGTVQIIRIRW